MITNRPERRVNYDQIAPTYNQRYTLGRLNSLSAALLSLAQSVGAEGVLEVGCGTGRWLAELQPVVRGVYGLDLSHGMLRHALQRKGQFHVTCGQASRLPFPDTVFDIVFCVNAFHHFDQPHLFLSEARRVLRPHGAMAVIGMDPHGSRDRWYIYDYFEGTYETDLSRFPSRETLFAWMLAAGFDKVEWGLAERLARRLVGRAVLDDPILQKHGTSQLALLTDAAYAAGIARIEAALAGAEAAGETLVFPEDISLAMITGRPASDP